MSCVMLLDQYYAHQLSLRGTIMAVVAGTFVATGASAHLTIETGDRRASAEFNILLAGAGAGDTVQLERSFDGGSTFYLVKEYDAIDANEVGAEPETGVLYRLNCTALAVAGPVTYRLSN